MKELPAELTIIAGDTEGDYCDPTDCSIARALGRVGVPVDDISGYRVRGTGVVCFSGEGDVGCYKWANGDEFSASTSLRVGTLVLKGVA